MPHDTVTIKLDVPEKWIGGLAQDDATLLEIFCLGLHEYRIRQAINLYREGAGSLGYVAELVGLPRRVLLEEARRHGLEPEYDEEALLEDLSP